jgi:hypothetical protein
MPRSRGLRKLSLTTPPWSSDEPAVVTHNCHSGFSVTRRFPPFPLQVVASQALASARAAAEDLAPTPGSSSRLCLQLAGALHTQVAQAMLVTAAGGPGNEAEAAHSLQVRSWGCLEH